MLNRAEKNKGVRRRRCELGMLCLLALAASSLVLTAEPLGYTLAWAYWPGSWAVRIAEGFGVVAALVGVGCCVATGTAMAAICIAWRRGGLAADRPIYLLGVVLLSAASAGLGISWFAFVVNWRP